MSYLWLSLSGATIAIPILPVFIILKAVTSEDQLIFGPSNSSKEISNIIYPIPVAWINYSSGGFLSLQLTPSSSGNIPGQFTNKFDRVGTDDFPVEALGELKSEVALADCSRKKE
ncbi:uncharacterized protein DS421_17g584580 [Arachis hypogaea]|nr:uncharacterized protein DS421_17g584580 [Arachis hypogaea]